MAKRLNRESSCWKISLAFSGIGLPVLVTGMFIANSYLQWFAGISLLVAVWFLVRSFEDFLEDQNEAIDRQHGD